jgi:hypothetical protein
MSNSPFDDDIPHDSPLSQSLTPLFVNFSLSFFFSLSFSLSLASLHPSLLDYQKHQQQPPMGSPKMAVAAAVAVLSS